MAALLATAGWSFAQTPDAAAREEAREERQTILRAADQLEMQQKTIEALQTQTEGLRISLAALQQENTKLRSELLIINKRLEDAAAQRAEEQKTLLAEVSKLIKEASAKAPAPQPAPPISQTGFYHTVEEGQTLSLIAKAYREQGVAVTAEQIRKANNIGADNLIRVGQKLFIPKS